jgi:23S rRNA (cytosine1962-C5)-methyltransferase
VGHARLHLRLKPAAENKVRSGHPWVFAQSIQEQNRPGETGEIGIVFDKKNNFLALGLYDANAPIRLRIIHTGKPISITTGWWRERFRESISKRGSIFNDQTNGGRLINGESDGFPALVLDRYDQSYVLKLYSSVWFGRVTEIVRLVESELNPGTLVLRLSRNIQAEAKGCGLEEGQILFGSSINDPVQFVENGLPFEADILKGQKTGFYLDQRENRREVGSLAKGKDVLNAFSFSGGFSLYAARGGARSVTDVDISKHALESSRRNFALNKERAVQQCEHKLVQADVFDWLKEKRDREFDLIILDPPSLAKRQTERSGALKAYGQLASSGAVLARKKGVLVCCSCSAHVRAEEFFKTVETNIRRGGRKFEILKTTREPLDHRASFREAEYLKAIYLRLD